MNLNHEIITFKDIDISTSKIYMRMMLRAGKKIKKYKQINLKLNELSLNIKEKKIMNFPYRSKFVFNYILTKDKNLVTQFINGVKLNRDYKKSKSIFESNEDDDENCEEESEDSTKEKNVIIKNANQLENNEIQNKENKNNDTTKKNNNNILSFNQRLYMFEKNGNIPRKNTTKKPELMPPARQTISPPDTAQIYLCRARGNVITGEFYYVY